MSESSLKPRYLILGGCGTLGRRIAKYLLTEHVAGSVRVVDKNNPITCFMNEEHMVMFKENQVEFVQADQTKQDHVERVLNERFDFIVNCCGESRFGLNEADYMIKCVVPVQQVCDTLKQKAIEPTLFVHQGSGHIYESDSTPHTENSKQKPWTLLGHAHKEAESVLQQSSQKYCVLRLATVYGEGDVFGLSPRLAIALTYLQNTEEKLRLLWGEDLKVNTVHCEDVVRAVQYMCTEHTATAYGVYNLVDSGDTTQGMLGTIQKDVFGIRVSYIGSFKSNLARLNLKGVTDDANASHYPIWMHLLRTQSISNTPISPLLTTDLVSHNHQAQSNAKLLQMSNVTTPFQLKYPHITTELIQSQLEYAVKQNLFPTYTKNG